MTPEQFAYWLQGFAELSPNTPPNATQWKQIQDHLQTVFKKVTPSYPNTAIPGNQGPTTIDPKPWWEWKPDPIPAYKFPEVICSVNHGAGGIPLNAGAGTSFCVSNLKYDMFTSAKEQNYKDINRKLV